MAYQFVDTTPQPGQAPALSSLQTIYNGNNLDQLLTDSSGSFTTLSVRGRGNMAKRIRTNEIPSMNGVTESNSATYQPREIVVKYRIKDKTNTGFVERVNRLNSYLRGAKQTLKFTDESNIFYSTAQTNDLPEEETNDLIGEILFFCSDPFKYSGEQQKSASSPVSYSGTEPVSPLIDVSFSSGASSYEIKASNGQFVRVIYNFSAGDRLIIDLSKRKVTINGIAQQAAYYWKSKPFQLQPGSNSFTITPAGATTTFKYRNRVI
jgi:predicted phage tail component-like protein